MSKKNLFEIFETLYEQAKEFSDMLDDPSDGETDARKEKRKKKRAKTENTLKEALLAEQEREKARQKKAREKMQAAGEKRKRHKAAREEHARQQRETNKKAKNREQQKEFERREAFTARRIASELREARGMWEHEQKRKDREAARETAKAASRFHPRNPAYLPKSVRCAPGIILKPKMDRIATGNEPIKFGGLPQLPDSVDWPAQNPDWAPHFYAQIDMAGLPRTLEGPGYHFDMPAFPRTGTLFVFHCMNEGSINEAEPHVVFVDEPVSHLPERQPPEDVIVLEGHETRYLRPDGIAPGGRVLRRQFAEPLAFMSTGLPDNLWLPRTEPRRDKTPSAQERAALLNAGLEVTLNEDTTNPEAVESDTVWDRYVAQSTRIPPSEHSIDSPHRFRWEFRQPQMFGFGDDVQGASFRKEGMIMLLQIGNGFGTPTMLADVALQVWITPEDLQAGRFDRVECTMDCS